MLSTQRFKYSCALYTGTIMLTFGSIQFSPISGQNQVLFFRLLSVIRKVKTNKICGVQLCPKKECALAHSRAEARLLRQPSTLAPSAHPRGAFTIVWKRSFLYDNKNAPGWRSCHRCPGQSCTLFYAFQELQIISLVDMHH